MKLVGLIAISAMLGAACGGSGSSSSNEPSQTTTTTNPAVNSADQELARKLALTLADLPPGWTSAPHSEAKSEKADAQLTECLHIPGTKLIPHAAGADSPDFTSPDQAEVKNSVSVTPSAANITSALDLLESPVVPPCMTTYFNALLKTASTKDAKFGTASVNPLSSEALGDRTVALRATIPVSSKGLEVNVYADVWVVQKGRVAVILDGLDEFSPFPTDTATQLIQKVLAKIPANTG